MAAILHLGNLEFKGSGNQNLASFEEPEQAHTVAKVLHTVYTNTLTVVKGGTQNEVDRHTFGQTSCNPEPIPHPYIFLCCFGIVLPCHL